MDVELDSVMKLVRGLWSVNMSSVALDEVLKLLHGSGYSEEFRFKN